MRKALSFISLGLLIGNLTGLTSASITTSLLSLVFAFAGGSTIALITKLEQKQIVEVEKMILYFSISCLLGVFSGIIISEFKLLSPSITSEVEVGRNKYLRNNGLSKANEIDGYYQRGIYTKEQAYNSLYAHIVTFPN